MFRRGVVVGALFLLGGALLLAFKQVTRVVDDPRRLELGSTSSSPVADPTFIFLAGLLMTIGILSLVGSVSPSTGWRRPVALAALGISLFLLFALHLPLYVNATVVGTQENLEARFSASHLFHTGDLYSLLAVFLIFLLTFGLLAVVVLALGHLLSPGRFGHAVAERANWAKNEAHLIASSLLLLFSLAVFLTFLGRTAARIAAEPPFLGGFFGANLLLFYYLQILFVALLLLVVVARAFLVNWGTQLPWDTSRVRESLDNIGKLELVAVVGALVFNLLVLGAPAGTDHVGLSEDPVFRLDSRGLAWFFMLLAVPYLPYAVSLRRMRRLLEPPAAFAFKAPPFSGFSLRVVIVAAAGLVLLASVGIGAKWSALTDMIAFSAWMTGVLLWASVSLRLERGLLEPSFRHESGPAYFAWFLIFGLVTGIMMWGAGNTFVGTFADPAEGEPTVFLDNPYGADLLLRVGGVSLLAFTVLLGLAVAKNTLGVKRSLLVPYATSFVGLVLLGVIVYSVSIWSTNQQISDAYAGFAFHQYYLEEKILVAILILALGTIVLWSVGRIVRHVLRPRAAPLFIVAQRAR